MYIAFCVYLGVLYLSLALFVYIIFHAGLSFGIRGKYVNLKIIICSLFWFILIPYCVIRGLIEFHIGRHQKYLIN